MSTVVRAIGITRTQTATYVAAKLVGSFQEILAELRISGSYNHDWTGVERALQTWMNEGSLRSATVEVWDAECDRTFAVFDYPLTYGTSGSAGEELRHDLSTTRNVARRAAVHGLPRSLKFRVVVDTESWAAPVDGWTSTRYRSRDDLRRRSMGEVASGPHIGAELEFWVR